MARLAMALDEVSITEQSANLEWFEAVRLAAATGTVTVRPERTREATRYRLQPHEELRQLGLAPSYPEVGVLLICGEVSELWTGANWVRHVDNLALRRRDLVRWAETELECALFQETDDG